MSSASHGPGNPGPHLSSQWLSRLRDAQLTATEVAEAGAHLAGCGECRARREDLAALGFLLRARRDAAAAELPPDFASRVMEVVATARPPLADPTAARPRALGQRWLAAVRAHRDLAGLGLLAAALAAVLLVMFAPGLRSHDDPVGEAAENEAEIHQLDVQGPGQDPVILQSAEGHTVIWMVAPTDGDGGQSTPAGP